MPVRRWILNARLKFLTAQQHKPTSLVSFDQYPTAQWPTCVHRIVGRPQRVEGSQTQCEDDASAHDDFSISHKTLGKWRPTTHSGRQSESFPHDLHTRHQVLELLSRCPSSRLTQAAIGRQR